MTTFFTDARHQGRKSLRSSALMTSVVKPETWVSLFKNTGINQGVWMTCNWTTHGTDYLEYLRQNRNGSTVLWSACSKFTNTVRHFLPISDHFCNGVDANSRDIWTLKERRNNAETMSLNRLCKMFVCTVPRRSQDFQRLEIVLLFISHIFLVNLITKIISLR